MGRQDLCSQEGWRVNVEVRRGVLPGIWQGPREEVEEPSEGKDL